MLAPLLLLAVHLRAPAVIYVAALVAGFVSDVLDGMVARRAGVATSFLRRLDSVVDIVFYLAVAYAAWLLYPGQLRPLAVPILALIGGELVNFVVARVKLGREASYHAWSAKAWGLTLFASLVVLFGIGSASLFRSRSRWECSHRPRCWGSL